jgi:hypothetical protein
VSGVQYGLFVAGVIGIVAGVLVLALVRTPRPAAATPHAAEAVPASS